MWESPNDRNRFSQGCTEPHTCLSRFEDGLRVDGDFDGIADDNSTAVQRRVPRHTLRY